jgi:choline dehydrogenase-like flavoprotein
MHIYISQVVGAALKVQGGVQGLRLADASVLPDMGSAGPVGSCFMLGDRCARLILEEAEQRVGGSSKGSKGRGGLRGRRRQ